MKVSVIVITYNEGAYIQECLRSILNQSFKDFELIIVDDCSSDKTAQVIAEIRDERIRYIKQDRNYGVSESRNAGVRQAKGECIFFTDADCAPTKYWIEEGLKVLRERKCVGVEGRTFYATAKTTISDRIVEKMMACWHGTGNIVYTKEILNKVGGFDNKFKFAFEDQDIAYRIEKYGDIVFSEDMIVIHQRKLFTISKLFGDAKRSKNAVQFIKKYRDYRNLDIIWWKIVYPRKLLILLCPFLLIPYYSFRGWGDIKLIPFLYFSIVYTRFIIWKEAIKERFFLI
jgi:glycosyltransferase involved in cell wall biosynthesis